MKKNSVTLHRVFTSPTEKVFKAFSSANAMAYWSAPYGFLCNVHHMDFKVGGKFRMTFINFTTDSSHSFGGEFLEIRPNEFIKYTDQFEDPNLPDLMITSIELRSVSCGTELFVTQEGIPSSVPVEMCYLGWQESLEKLKKLVEPNIPDA